ncbi:MAG: cytochrome c biogenesis protein CcsA [Solirubrobacterales bacterium]|nr:cytochrome c biogenesis protein CcsA [Solirubrobacterales bacterium]
MSQPQTDSRFFSAPSRPSRDSATQFARGLKGFTIAAIIGLIITGILVFWYAPIDADQGMRQKIFFLHVPLAIVALGGFFAGGVMAVQYLRTRDSAWDLRSYVAIHLSLIIGVVVLLTGMIWAKTAWGVFWEWKEPTLVSFLIVFLIFAIYQPMRFAIEDPERQAQTAAVYAILAGAFVPLNFIAVRLSESLIHPRVLTATGGNMPTEMRITFFVALITAILLFVALWKFELVAKSISMQIKKLNRGTA